MNAIMRIEMKTSWLSNSVTTSTRAQSENTITFHWHCCIIRKCLLILSQLRNQTKDRVTLDLACLDSDRYLSYFDSDRDTQTLALRSMTNETHNIRDQRDFLFLLFLWLSSLFRLVSTRARIKVMSIFALCSEFDIVHSQSSRTRFIQRLHRSLLLLLLLDVQLILVELWR